MYKLLLGSFFVLAMISTQCVGQQLDTEAFSRSRARDAVIMVTVTGRTQARGRGKRADERSSQGTAFFIDDKGFALTAAHIFFVDDDWHNQSKRVYPIPGSELVTGRIGSAGASLRIFSLVAIDTSHDAALIQLKDGKPAEQTRFLHVCNQVSSRSEWLSGIGFPLEMGMQTPSGHLLGSLIGDQFPIDIAINPGMSGGPVVNVKGQVVGIATEGLRGFNVERQNRLLPSQFLVTELQSAVVQLDCVTSLDLSDTDAAALQFKSLIEEANDVISRDHDAAAYKYEQAKAIYPERWEAFYGLSRVNFALGNFEDAAGLAAEAFGRKVPSDYSLLFQSALSNEGSENFDGAMLDYRKIVSNVKRSSILYRDALFGLGQVELRKAILEGRKEDDPVNVSLLSNAEENFRAFLKLGGLPAHFAHYHLACISALRGQKADAHSELVLTRTLLERYRGESKDRHVQLLDKTLFGSVTQRPGDPVVCPALKVIGVNASG